MDRYSRMSLEDLVVPIYQETSLDSYPSPDIWGTEWSNMNPDKCFDHDVINNGFSGGLYSQMEIGKSGKVVVEEEEDTKRLKASGCFDHSLHDFNGLQQMDDMFLSSILEDVPGNDDMTNGREVPMFHYNWETCQDMSLMDEAPMNENMEETSAEELVLHELQKASEKLTDDTRKCFRDTFYRLAKNSQQNSEELLENRVNSEIELKTNSIDRAIANLTFNKMESNMRNMPPLKRLSSIQG